MSSTTLELHDDLAAKKRKLLLSGVRRTISASSMIARFKADAFRRIEGIGDSYLRELLSLGPDIDHSSIVRREYLQSREK